MNKKLLTAAIGAALAASPMLVGAAGPTVYGKMNVGLASVDNGTDSAIVMTDDASRFGVKGDEDLGGGLKAIYQWEVGIRVDDGTDGSSNPVTGAANTLTARDAYIGLAGGWGSLRFGQYNTGYKLVSVPIELMGDTHADFTANGFSGESRQKGNIGYTSPNFNGFSFKAEFSTGNERDTTAPAVDQSNPMNVAVYYKGGPLYVAAGYYDYDIASGVNGLESATKIAAGYEFGAFEVVAAFESQSDQGTYDPIDTMHVAGAFKSGNNQFVLSYTDYSKDKATNADCSMIGAAWFHYFSKTTKGGLIYNDIDNDAGATCNGRLGVASSQPGPAAGKDPSSFQVQIQKSF